MEDQFESDKKRRMDLFRERYLEDSPHAIDLLKGHLLIEEVIEEIIASACSQPSSMYEARMSFFSKAKLAHAISGVESPVWSCIEKLNSARNELAHGRVESQLIAKIDSYIACTKQGFEQADWETDRAYNLEMSVIVTHAAISRIAADRVRT